MKIADAEGGEVEVDDEPGRLGGATVSVSSSPYDPGATVALDAAGTGALRDHLDVLLGTATYDREALVEVLTYHTRRDITGCRCGWARLGASWPEHVAEVYEAALRGRG